MSVKITKRLLKSHIRTCPFKVKLTPEDAESYLLAAQKETDKYHDANKLGLYICTACNYLHIGHRPKWAKEA